MYLNGTILGLTRDEIDERFDEIVAFADIGDFLDQPVKFYSSGMALRLAFAVIANVDADILVIDEALAVGDAFFVQKCMRFVRGFMERGTVFFVSHDTGAIVNLCQRAIWLDKGIVKAIGNPKDVTEGYLASLFESQQGPSASRANASLSSATQTSRMDQRLSYLNDSPLRNDIELFQFDPEATFFGLRDASITEVQLHDRSGPALTWCVGGEDVVLRIRCIAHQQLFSPIVGFYMKDRLGQLLFGDNTYLTRIDSPLSINAGEHFEAVFEFRMPVLPIGDYSVCAAVAVGSQEAHVQHHWIHDAVFFRSHASSVHRGLLGIPMSRVDLRVLCQ